MNMECKKEIIYRLETGIRLIKEVAGKPFTLTLGDECWQGTGFLSAYSKLCRISGLARLEVRGRKDVSVYLGFGDLPKGRKETAA